ncbi:hemolysin III family protein [Sulfitobacter sp. F26169L]|uniref:PAQR family membrane homeostasis protein TrhA n=1 Tax=Sulfitobacter sp. F26169L TaxID=2996015 RepID=UPI002260DFFA|nr:hemolysin III family protein [Sulfitobacter sp. F26169L]MCX7565091.1 hemolysin III family protein [Sulfitobacter sp. F26169L]
MIAATFPSPVAHHRRADLYVHLIGLALIIGAGFAIITKAAGTLEMPLVLAVAVYVICALVSNLASIAYHFSTWHTYRKLLRRIDHAAIYPSIAGTFTPFFVQADTTWTLTLLVVSWALSAVAIWNKITNETIKSRWSTASYLGLGAIGLSALPDLGDVPIATLWCILAGALSYVIGTAIYARKSMPFRYSIWHLCVNLGGVFMFAGIWMALF